MRAFQALTSEPWAIEPSWLPILAALAQRNHGAPELKAVEGWSKRDYDLFAGPAGRRLEGARYTMVTDGGVAIIPVFGPIFPRANMMTEYSGAASATQLQADHAIALRHPDVGAVMMLYDTPGGAVSGINALADQINAGKKSKYTMSYVSGTAASAGYWLASQGHEIAGERTAMVGSIGVVAAMPKQVEADGDGYLTVEVVSSNAPNKRIDPTTDDGQAKVREMLDAIEAEFIADVARGRGIKAADVPERYGQGGVLVGAAAKAAGMIDKIQSYEASVAALSRMVANQRKVEALKGR
ncbi:S49 family peptidase [Magnetospirillum aberrantis]|uniref:S49 family peptidase n=1 Tax=Magnetospirillum aberrantis SpK TaxID=908842 RepID=A0A7C9UU26_9PROT|nr:S49 family peptidase [Magnetospirillum aberrantis]NFV80006.1 S49 family peptidase [Magnetospirillum aberrantis SpK]